MSFIGNENVGVGTTNPLYHLDVSGNCHVTGNSYTLGSLGVGTSTPSYTLDISGNGRFNGALYSSGVSTMLKQISNQVSTYPTQGVIYQNTHSTPMFVLATIVGINVGWGVNCDSTSNPTTQIFNSYNGNGHNCCFFIVMPYYYYVFTGNISLGQVYLYY